MRNVKSYYRPRSAEEAVKLKQEFGHRSVYLNGGTDLLVHKRADVEAVIDIRHCDLNDVRYEGEDLIIGGAALLRDAEKATAGIASGMLTKALRDTAPWLIRNAASVAGNSANASPAADSVPALLSLDAQLVLLNGGRESVPLADIFEGPHQTSLGDRLIESIRVPGAARSAVGVFTKLARSASDIALVNLAMAMRLEGDVAYDVRIALGAVAPTPMRAIRAEAALEGQVLRVDLIEEAARLVAEDVRPITDWRASEGYRRRMSAVLVRRALKQIAGGDGKRRTV